MKVSHVDYRHCNYENMNAELSTVFSNMVYRLSEQWVSFRNLYTMIGNADAGFFFIAGGTVRDLLMDNLLPGKDIDLFTSADGFDLIKPFLEAHGELKINPFGNYRWFPVGEQIYYDIISIPNFYNGLWPCKDIVDVLNQFDITVNAVAFDLASGAFINPQNGWRDINSRTLRAVRFDYPELALSSTASISRNSILWFRYQHYAQKLKLSTESVTQEWIRLNAFRIGDLPMFKELFFDPEF
jgi:hypothetical protein